MKTFISFLVIFLKIFTAVNADATVYCDFDTSGGAPRCFLYNITQVTAPNELIIIDGQPSTFRDNLNTGITIVGPQVINYIPTGIFQYFPSLTIFYAINASVTNLVTDAFVNCENLKHINLEGNNFADVPAQFAQTCSNLEHLNLESNNIQVLSPYALKGLNKLLYFSLKNNKISCIPPAFFSYTTFIKSIRLDSNEITAFDPRTFANLQHLSEINAGFNSISYLPNMDLNNTGIYTFIFTTLNFELHDNPIYAIDPNFFPATFTNRQTDLLYIGFYHSINGASCILQNGITYMDNQAWSSPTIYTNFTSCYNDWNPPYLPLSCDPSVTTTTHPSDIIPETTAINIPPGNCATDKICRYYLDWNNQYTCVIDGAEGTVTSISGTHYLSFTDADLTRLYFTNSHLSKVPNILFQKFPNLKYLHVRNSGLSVINDQTFNECGNLEFVDASDNEIFRVEETALRNCTKLKIIDLTGNEIDHVSVGLYQNDPALQRVHLRRLSDWILA